MCSSDLRFIGQVWQATSEEEARARIEETKKQHYDARHNCWCFRVREGGAERSIDLSYPSAWRINYKVRDANGNTVKVNLRYLVVAKPPTVTPGKPGGDGGPGEDNGSSGRDPLPPSSVTVDPETGLTHAVINDEVTVPTEDDPMTPAAMASFMEEIGRASCRERV